MFLILGLDIIVIISLLVVGRKRLENALPLFAFFLVVIPFESRLVIPGMFDLTTVRVAVVTMLLSYIARREPRYTGPIPLFALMILHIIVALASAVQSLLPATSLKQLLTQILEYYLVYVIFVRLIVNTQTVYKIIFAILAAMGVCCVFGLFEAYGMWSIISIFPSSLWTTYYDRATPLYIEWGRGLRIRSTFPHPILLGDALAMSIPLAFYLLSRWARGWYRPALWVALVLMFWGVYKTSSRGPWMAVGLSCGLLMLMASTRVRLYVVVLASLSLVVLLARPGVLQTITYLYEATTDLNNPVGSSYAYRDALIEAITEAVSKSPDRTLFGYGLGTFRELGLDIRFLNSTQHWYTCDNGWAAFLYETGYIGLAVSGLLLLWPVMLTFRAYSTLPRPHRYLSGVLFISLVVFNLALVSVAGYGWGQQGAMAWMFIALSIRYPRLVGTDVSRTSRRVLTSDAHEDRYAGAASPVWGN